MGLFKNKLIKWSLRIIIVVCLIFAFWLSVAAFPQPAFKYKQQFGQCTVYSDIEFTDSFTAIMNDVNDRLSANELHTPQKNTRVFICHDQKIFSAFATISLLNPDIQGFNLSVFGNTFICVPKINALKESHGGSPKYNIREGNIAHTIAHEIVHEYTMDAIGFSKYRKLPVWKSEGYAEYGANCVHFLTDTVLTFDKRIEINLDEFCWDPTEAWVRSHYQSALMIEFLHDIEGLTIEEIMNDSIQYADTYQAMMNWHKRNIPNMNNGDGC